jgi:flavodoxin
MRVLVAYYSRTHTTLRVADGLARELGAAVEVITELHARGTPRAAWRCAAEALLCTVPSISPDRHDPRAYDLVVVGSPVWYGAVSSPVRAYLRRHAGTFNGLALFVTCGGWRPDRALGHMAEVSRHTPRATLALTRRDRNGRDAQSKILAFANALRPESTRVASDPGVNSARARSAAVGD